MGMAEAERVSRRPCANPPAGIFPCVDEVERNRCSRLRQIVPDRPVDIVLRPLAKDDPLAVHRRTVSRTRPRSPSK